MILFSDFFKVPILAYRVIRSSGEPFGEPFRNNRQFYKAVFSLEYLAYIYAVIMNFMYCLKAYKSNDWLELLGSMPVFLFSLSGMLKEAAFYMNYKEMKLLKNDLEAMFPKTKEQQLVMQTKKYLTIANTFIKPLQYMGTIGMSWIAIPITLSTVNYLRTGRFEKILALYNDYPYDWNNSNFLFAFTYCFECFSTTFGIITFMSVDFILCGVLCQCLMQLDFISCSFKSFSPEGRYSEDVLRINPIIQQHNRCLE